jgi:hypothetical protein
MFEAWSYFCCRTLGYFFCLATLLWRRDLSCCVVRGLVWHEQQCCCCHLDVRTVMRMWFIGKSLGLPKSLWTLQASMLGTIGVQCNSIFIGLLANTATAAWSRLQNCKTFNYGKCRTIIVLLLLSLVSFFH